MHSKLYIDLKELLRVCDRYTRIQIDRCLCYMEYKYGCQGLVNQNKFNLNNFTQGLLNCRCLALALDDELLLRMIDYTIKTMNENDNGEGFIKTHKFLLGEEHFI